MAKKAANPIPEGFHTVTPYLFTRGAAGAIEFYKKAFGAEEILRLPSPDGTVMHAEVKVGDSIVMIGEESPERGTKGPLSLGGSAVGIHLYVPDADAFMDRAVKAGAKVIMPVADQFWGDRHGQVEDPYGHRWSIATHTTDVTLEECVESLKKAP